MRFFVVLLTFSFTIAAPCSAFQSSSPDELYRSGLDSYNAGRFEAAVELLRKAAALRPNVPDYRFSLGLAYLKAGRAKEAARELEAVRGMIGLRRETRIKEPEVLLHSATAYIQLGKLDTARKRLTLALERAPDLTEAHYGLGLIEQKQGHRDAALRRFQAVLERDPDHPQANLAVAEWLRGQGRGEEALERLQHAVHGAPASFDVQMVLGTVAFELGDVSQAEQAFRSALELNPDNQDAPFNLGTVLLARQAHAEAIDLLEPLVRHGKPHDGASFNLAQAYRGAGRAEDALREVEALVGRSPTYPESHFLLGLIREELEDMNGAEQAYRKEIELREDFTPAYLNLAVLLERSKRQEEALEVLRKALALQLEEAQAETIQSAVAALEAKVRE